MSIKYHIFISSSLTLVIVALIFCHTRFQENKTSDYKKIAIQSESSIEQEDFVNTKNLLLNGDFSSGLENWKCDKNVNVYKDNGKNVIQIQGSSNFQTRLWQTVDTISGHVYKFSIRVRANQSQAFAIFRDDQIGNERYVFTSPTAEWKVFSRDFISHKNGKYRIFLSCKGTGDFYYSEAYLVDKDNVDRSHH